MSPTEFSNYIKQRAMQQQIHHHHHQQQQQQQHQTQQQQQSNGLPVSQSSPNSRSLSPGLVGGSQQHTDPSAYFFQHTPTYHPQFPHRNIFDSASHGSYLQTDLYTGAKFSSSYLDPGIIGHQFYGSVNSGSGSQTSSNLGPIGTGSGSSVATAASQQQADKTALVDGLNNFGLGSVTPYPASQYQHLLVAN